jgi:transposase
MGSAIALRADFDGPALRRLARTTKDAAQARRLLALAEIYDGGSRTDAARIGGVTLQIIRDWVLRFNARGPDGLINRKAPGNRPKLNAEQRQALASMVESGPIPAIHGVVRWRRKDLARWLFEEFRIELAGSSWLRRRSGGSCAPWAFASSRRGRATTLKTSWRWTLLKRPPRRTGGDPGHAR